jgi:hypothetical protein
MNATFLHALPDIEHHDLARRAHELADGVRLFSEPYLRAYRAPQMVGARDALNMRFREAVNQAMQTLDEAVKAAAGGARHLDGTKEKKTIDDLARRPFAPTSAFASAGHPDMQVPHYSAAALQHVETLFRGLDRLMQSHTGQALAEKVYDRMLQPDRHNLSILAHDDVAHAGRTLKGEYYVDMPVDYQWQDFTQYFTPEFRAEYVHDRSSLQKSYLRIRMFEHTGLHLLDVEPRGMSASGTPDFALWVGKLDTKDENLLKLQLAMRGIRASNCEDGLHPEKGRGYLISGFAAACFAAEIVHAHTAVPRALRPVGAPFGPSGDLEPAP